MSGPSSRGRTREAPEREAIWAIQVRKHGRDPKDYDTVQLAKATEGLTGSEIETVFIESLYQAFAEKGADGPGYRSVPHRNLCRCPN